MSDRAPYSRVYWSVMDDDKFDGIREDMRHFGSWCLLLVLADMAWPVPAYLPPPVSKASLKALTACGLIDILPGHRFRVHGLDAEREKRSDTGRNAAAKRWHTESIADPMLAEAKPSKAETEQSRAEAPREDPASDYWSLTGRYPKDAALSWIDRLTATYGAQATTTALVKAYTGDRSTQTLLGRTEDILRSDARQLDLKERAAEKERIAEARAVAPKVDAWKEEYRRLVEERYGAAS